MDAYEREFASVFRDTDPIPDDTPQVKGYDFNQGINYKDLLGSYIHTGFQATNVGLAIDQINQMIQKRKEPLEKKKDLSEKDQAQGSSHLACTIFLGFTSNMISCGVRESLRYLAQHHMVDVMVTTAGGIEEDLIKCLGTVYIGDFSLSGKELYRTGYDRIGNLLMPNTHYKKLFLWIVPIWQQMLLEQETQGVRWTPSKVIHRLGKEIDNPESVCYWAYKNNIPIFSPALTDGAIGDTLFLFSSKQPGLIIDLVEDVARINKLALGANNTGMIILGGGLAKHHICNANCWRNGADYSVFVNSGQEFDGSDSGARPDEAVSWGKIKKDAKPVKIFGDASVIFPLLVAETFAVTSAMEK